jgi:glycosyltransferase involved in cell wall biosynthesis
LATFNEADYIEKTISSLLAQSTPEFDLELLVIDGDSSDSTPQIVSRWARVRFGELRVV